MDQYRIFDEAGTWETAYIFRFENCYLTMNSEGGVFTTDTLDEGC